MFGNFDRGSYGNARDMDNESGELTRLISEKIGRIELVKRFAHNWFWRS